LFSLDGFSYLTQLQITQFITVNIVHATAYYWHFFWAKGKCTSYDNISNPVGSAVIWSYLILFLQLYYETYVAAGKRNAAAAGGKGAAVNKPKKA
jgi:hypothetical protein